MTDRDTLADAIMICDALEDELLATGESACVLIAAGANHCSQRLRCLLATARADDPWDHFLDSTAAP